VKNYQKKIIKVLLSIAVFLIFLAGLMEYRAAEELGKARSAREASDFEAADRHYFQALNWYAPWGSSQRAADELMDLGLEHLKEGRREQSYQSFLRLRGALMAARSFYLPRADLIKEINLHLTSYLAEQRLGAEADPEALKAKAAVYLQLYSDNPPLGQGWYFLAVFGFLGWVAAGFRLIVIFFNDRSCFKFKQRLKDSRVFLAAFICAYGLWLLSMSRAY
jgi:hypothetical protein